MTLLLPQVMFEALYPKRQDDIVSTPSSSCIKINELLQIHLQTLLSENAIA